MKKTIIFASFTSVFLLYYACSSKDRNEPPSTVALIYPVENLLCTENTINFDWSDAVDAEEDIVTYTITIAKDRNLTNIVEEQTINSSNITITLEKSVAYYWRVISKDDQENESDPSPTYAFFTKGDGSINAVPFTAELISPANESTVDSGSISLMWNGSDSNPDDTLTYEFFFGESSDPALLENGLSATSYTVTVESGKTYYWKVNTSDNNGAKSIGQTWMFTVN